MTKQERERRFVGKCDASSQTNAVCWRRMFLLVHGRWSEGLAQARSHHWMLSVGYLSTSAVQVPSRMKAGVANAKGSVSETNAVTSGQSSRSFVFIPPPRFRWVLNPSEFPDVPHSRLRQNERDIKNIQDAQAWSQSSCMSASQYAAEALNSHGFCK